MTTLDTDHIALSNELHTLSERFTLEATLWLEPHCKEQLNHAARLLAEIARAIANNATDLQTAEAYALAATRIITEVEGARRFMRNVTDLPTAARRHVQP